MIQLKATRRAAFKLYGFGIHKNDYRDCLVICVCIEDKRTWFIDGLKTHGLKAKLNIGIGKSKYSQYETCPQDFSTSLQTFYLQKILFELSDCVKPIAACQQQEQDYRRVRESEIPFLEYVYPAVEGLHYDFTINGKHVQEKVCSTREDRSDAHVAGLYTNNGKSEGKRQYKAYRLGENDYYWLWLKHTRIFYLIPEQVLYEHGFISDAHVILPKRSFVNISMNHERGWYQDYKFDLDNLDKQKISQMFA